MNNFSHVPPGFRFHPTDEELVDYYLRKKVASKRIDWDVIKHVDLYKIEPWDLEEKCKIGTEEQNDWYFFSHKDKKYPTGTRTNRATTAGFWKATGRDKPIYSKNNLIGMRKTLVFYKGRAPNGQKSDWIMHEYRLETNENGTPQEEGWAVCRAFKKRVATIRNAGEASPCWYDEHVSFMPELDSPKRILTQSDQVAYNHHLYSYKKELELHYQLPQDPLLHLPQLESPRLPTYINHSSNIARCSTFTQDEALESPTHHLQIISVLNNSAGNEQVVDQMTDWRVLDKFVASQLSHDEVSKEAKYVNAAHILQLPDKQDATGDCASTSTSSSQIELWK